MDLLSVPADFLGELVFTRVKPRATSTPGLVVTRGLGEKKGGWVVTHAASGHALNVGLFHSEHSARRFAEAIEGVCDWTQPASVVGTTAIRDECRLIFNSIIDELVS